MELVVEIDSRTNFLIVLSNRIVGEVLLIDTWDRLIVWIDSGVGFNFSVETNSFEVLLIDD